MSQLLDPMHRRYLDALGVAEGDRAVEVGVGNGSISAWLAERVGPTGRVVAVDLDLSLIDVPAMPQLELRTGDIVAAPVEPADFELVTARAVLHHVADAEAAVRNLVASLAPGGSILLIEPDFLPVRVAEPPEVRAFWDGWLAWSREEGIDYQIGRTLAPRLAAAGLEQVGGAAETAVFNGGSPWADYWTRTIVELRSALVASGQGGRRADRRVPGTVRGSELVDAGHRVHRGPRTGPGGRMTADVALATFHAGWREHQRRLLDALRDLQPEHLALRAGPGGWTIWQMASHMAGGRAFWFHDVLGEGDDALRDMFRIERTTVPGLSLEDAGWEDDETNPRTAPEIVDAFERTWAMIDACLERWTSDDLAVGFTREGYDREIPTGVGDLAPHRTRGTSRRRDLPDPRHQRAPGPRPLIRGRSRA